MAIKDITSRCWILALVERDDGRRILLGDGAYDFTDSQQHFAGNTIVNDVVDIQGNDGYLLAGQVRRSTAQEFNGYIGDGSTLKAQIETLRREFLGFFLKNHFYRVIYVFADGSAIQRQRGFIVDPPTVQELYQVSPQYHVALNFEDVNYYSYAESADGEEIYSKSATLGLSVTAHGGLVWDDIGIVWDESGAVWEQGGSAAGAIFIDSIDTVYPVWRVRGVAINPTLTDATTGLSLVYNGTVTATQELVIDMNRQLATLNGTNVIGNVSGDWVAMAPGDNRLTYSAANADAPSSVVEWQEIVG